MTSIFCLTVRYLDPVPQFHGRNDDGDPEWPPSPLRLFQALVCAAATRWREQQFEDYAQPALQWLEWQQPAVVTPSVPDRSFGYRMYVPNNSGDLMTAAWARGDTETTMAKFRVEKDVRPTHLNGEAVHFLFPLPDGQCPHFEVLQAAARSITHLGWGIDMVAGNAELLTDEQAAALKGQIWRPTDDKSGTPLRVPMDGTLDGLMTKHAAFLGRLSKEGFKPVPPLAAFKVVGYRRATDPSARPWCAFAILKPDASGNRAFDTARRARDVAAWTRHATAEVCRDWPDALSFVHGHGADGNQLKGETADQRFQYLPLPTINPVLNRVESIRRVLIAAPSGFRDRIEFIRRRLPGQDLMWDGMPVGLLNILPASDWVLKHYTRESTTWSTVTPIIWPGYDDRDSRKTEGLLRKAFVQGGVSKELADGILDLEWRHVGFRAGLDLAKNYTRPDKLTGPMFHVRVRFSHPVRGPLAVGAGRYRGLGLFAAESEESPIRTR